MSSDDLPVAVVVVTYHSADLLPGLVASLGPGMGDVLWRMVVADNSSDDESARRVQELVPDAVVVRMPGNRGYAAGINAAVAAAPDHRAVLVLNPDVRLGPGCVPELLSHLERARAGIVVPRLVDAQDKLVFSMRREPRVLRMLGDTVLGTARAGRLSALGEMVTDPPRYDHVTEVDWAEGSTQLISAECWTACGPWDESFFLYSEETEYNLRARSHGFAVVYVPTARAQHLEGGSSTSPRLFPLVVANRLALFRRRHGLPLSGVFWAVLVLREASRACLGRPESRAALLTLLSPARLAAARGPEWLDASAPALRGAHGGPL